MLNLVELLPPARHHRKYSPVSRGATAPQRGPDPGKNVNTVKGWGGDWRRRESLRGRRQNKFDGLIVRQEQQPFNPRASLPVLPCVSPPCTLHVDALNGPASDLKKEDTPPVDSHRERPWEGFQSRRGGVIAGHSRKEHP
ncbi:unnamed protein product [Gadus morhua 'NCC']